MTTTADAFIALGNWAPINIENSYFEGMGDDAINIHAMGCFVGRIPDSKEQTFPIVDRSGNDCAAYYHAGDLVQIVSPIDAQVRGLARITSLTPVDGKSETLITLDKPVGNLMSGSLPTNSPGHIYTADIVYDVSAASPGSSISKNVFGRFRGHAIVDKSPNSDIKRNIIRNANGPAMSFGQILGSTEGPLPWNIHVVDNVVIGGDETGGLPIRGSDQIDLIAGNFSGKPVNGAADMIFYHNQFLDATGRVFNIQGAHNISIKNNYIESSLATRRPVAGPVIHMDAASEITISELFIEDRRPSTQGVIDLTDPNARVRNIVVNAIRR
jgi:hypothetical protein